MVQVTLRGVRLAFADIWQARPPKDGKGEAKFGATFILDPKKDKEAVKEIRAAIQKVAKEKWKQKGARIGALVESDKQKFCWFEEDMVNDDGDEVPGFEGMFYIRTKSPIQPTLLDRDRTELTRGDGRPYPGCYVVAKIDVWAQDNTHGKAIRAQVQGIQFMKDGEAFGGGTKAKAEEFDDLSDLGEDDDAPAPKKRRPADEDDEPAPKPKKKRPPVDDDDDDIG